MVVSCLRKFRLGILVFFLLFVSVFWVKLINLKLITSEEFNNSVSSFISIEGADEYVIATLRSGETVSKQIFNKTFFDLPIGDAEMSMSVTANYKYFVRLGEITHHLVDETLYIDVPDIELSVPVAFDIRSMSESSKKTGFAPREDLLIKDLRVDMAKKLEINGERQKAFVYEHGAKSIADNFNKYLEKNGFSGAYKEIVVSFNHVNNRISRVYREENENCEYFPCAINLQFGGYHLFSPPKENVRQD